MATNAQATANLANAQLSTGPRTTAGKAASSLNGLKHGLTAKTVLLPGEDPAEYEALSSGMLSDLYPLNTHESALAQELIDLTWRLQRVSRVEARILSADVPDTQALNHMSLHASRMKRQYSATMKEYEAMHRPNLKLHQKERQDAWAIAKADEILKRPSTFDSFGFDFTLESLQAGRERQSAIYKAEEIVNEWELDQMEEDDDLDRAA